MAVFRRIVVAVDGSSPSNRALREAIELAKDQQSELRIVFVVDVFALTAETPVQLTQYEVAERKAGDLALKQAAALARKAGIEAETSHWPIRFGRTPRNSSAGFAILASA